MTSFVPPHISPVAMVLAAGLGTRMQPLTLTTPKPLLRVGGRTMLDHALDRLFAAGIRHVVVNAYYLAEQIIAHCATRTDMELLISREDDLLDTGGGIKKALHYFGGLSFLVLNADLPWVDDDAAPSLPLMMESFDAARMDAQLLLMPVARARGFGPSDKIRGDFVMEQDGRIHRRDAMPPFPYVMIGAQIVRPALYEAVEEVKFSNNRVWDAAENAHRLFGAVHQGTCYHVGTPEDWKTANELFTSGAGWG